MRLISTCTASLLIVGMSVTVCAQSEQQNVTYSDGSNTRSMAVEPIQFSPLHPEVCLEKKSPPVENPTPPPVAAAPKGEKDTDGDRIVDSKDECPETPHGYKVDPTGCPVSVTLHLHFAFNSSVIPVSDYPEVKKLAKVMKENPAAKAIIVGHTDYTGSDEYNQKLSEKRSQALANKLIENGIEKNRIAASGKGEKEPVATNSTREGRALNRRTEVQLQ